MHTSLPEHVLLQVNHHVKFCTSILGCKRYASPNSKTEKISINCYTNHFVAGFDYFAAVSTLIFAAPVSSRSESVPLSEATPTSSPADSNP